MEGREDLDSFLGKWRQRWPEWRVAEVSAVIEPDARADALEGAASIATALLGQRLLDGDPSSVPLQAHAALGAGADEGSLRAEAAKLLLRDWPDADGLSRAARIHLALLRARLDAMAAEGRFRPVPAWRTLALAWRAARHSVPPA